MKSRAGIQIELNIRLKFFVLFASSWCLESIKREHKGFVDMELGILHKMMHNGIQ